MTRAFAHTRGARLWLCGIRAERGAVLCASRVLLPRLCPSCQLGHARGRVACRCCPRVFTRKHVVERACMIVRTDVCLPAQLPGGRIRRRSHGGNRKLALRLRRAGHLLPLSSREPPSHPGAGSVACLPVYRTPGMLTAVAAVAVPHRWLACTPAARRPPPAARRPPLLSFSRHHQGHPGMVFPPSHDSRVPLPAFRATCVCSACVSVWARSASSAWALSRGRPAASRTVRARGSASAALSACGMLPSPQAWTEPMV